MIKIDLYSFKMYHINHLIKIIFMEEAIKDYLRSNGYQYTQITDQTSLKIIYDAIINKQFNTEEFTDPLIYLYYGIYYESNNNVKNAIKYYKNAISLENDIAAFYLGCIYKNKQEVDKMITYFEIAARKNNINAIYSLAEYYQSIKYFNKMEKYYDMGISLGDEKCMINLANYYKKTNIRITKMIKLFDRAIDEKKSIYAMNSLADHYNGIKNYELMLKYLKMSAAMEYMESYILIASYYKQIKDYQNMLFWLNSAIEKNSTDAMINIGCYYRDRKDHDNMEKYCLMAFNKGDNEGLYILINDAEEKNDTDKYNKYVTLGANKNDYICIEKKLIM